MGPGGYFPGEIQPREEGGGLAEAGSGTPGPAPRVTELEQRRRDRRELPSGRAPE